MNYNVIFNVVDVAVKVSWKKWIKATKDERSV